MLRTYYAFPAHLRDTKANLLLLSRDKYDPKMVRVHVTIKKPRAKR